jgi:hypothetical protein
MSDFDRRFEALMRNLASKDAFEKTTALLEFHLEWAEAVKDADPEVALRQYQLAENCQATIGSYATGSGEGLASMVALYEIMGKRAVLLERLKRVRGALAIWEEIQADPNGLGENTPAAANIRRLKSR